jgi:hypothetical protein
VTLTIQSQQDIAALQQRKKSKRLPLMREESSGEYESLGKCTMLANGNFSIADMSASVVRHCHHKEK